MNIFQIDDLLEQLAVEGRNHFAPHYVCQRLGWSPSYIKQIGEYLLSLINIKLVALFEVECPNGDIDFYVTDQTKIPWGTRTCEVCLEEYTPDPERIWLAFNFTDSYLQYVKKKLVPNHHLGQESCRLYVPIG